MAIGTVEGSVLSLRANSGRDGNGNTEAIVTRNANRVKHGDSVERTTEDGRRKQRRRRKKARRQSHGSAWRWKQTDTWYYTLPGTKKRIPLFDEDGNRIRGVENKQSGPAGLGPRKAGPGLASRGPAGFTR